jgi:hypothetical protein
MSQVLSKVVRVLWYSYSGKTEHARFTKTRPGKSIFATKIALTRFQNRVLSKQEVRQRNDRSQRFNVRFFVIQSLNSMVIHSFHALCDYRARPQ